MQDYADGDTQIILCPGEKFQGRYHAQVLREHSPILAKLLDKKFAAPLNKAALLASQPKYHLELSTPPSEKLKGGGLSRMRLDQHGNFVSTERKSIMYNNFNGRVPPLEASVYEQYDNCFRAMYNKPLFYKGTALSDVLATAIALLDVADYLECVPVVAQFLQARIMEFGQTAYQSLSGNPVSFLILATRLESATLFKQSLIHVVGKWNSVKDSDKDLLRNYPKVLAILNRKVADIVERQKALAKRIMGFYPDCLFRTEGTNTNAQSYAHDIMMWIALSWMRHWFGVQIAVGNGHSAPDGGWVFWKMIAAGGAAYLDRPALNQFHGKFFMSRKAMVALEGHIEALKIKFKEFVIESKLLSNLSEIDLSKHQVEYLLSCEHDEINDLPWDKEKRNTISMQDTAAQCVAGRATPTKRTASMRDDDDDDDDEMDEHDDEDEDEEKDKEDEGEDNDEDDDKESTDTNDEPYAWLENIDDGLDGLDEETREQGMDAMQDLSCLKASKNKIASNKTSSNKTPSNKNSSNKVKSTKPSTAKRARVQ